MSNGSERTPERPLYATRESIDWEATAEMVKADRDALREQLAAAEAVIEKAREAAQPVVNGEPLRGRVIEALDSVPSRALATVKADAWDEGARYVSADSTYTEMFDIPANPYRSGSEGSGS